MEQGISYLIERLEAIDGKFDEKLDKILIQTTKTNGRVTSLEDRFKKTEYHVEILKENKDINMNPEFPHTPFGYLFHCFVKKNSFEECDISHYIHPIMVVEC